MKITITKNGPYVVDGGIPLKEVDSIPDDQEKGVIAYKESKDHGVTEARACLCRCGHSNNKPFCDGHHTLIGFDGTETNDRADYDEKAELMHGAIYDALDKEELCAVGRFCDVGINFWNALEREDEANQAYTKHVGCNCPSGRLTLLNKETGEKLEPKLEKEIYLIKDVPEKHLGPIHLRGGIQVIGTDGFEYEERNRVTLCRCGESNNLPFCDATHLRCKHMEID